MEPPIKTADQCTLPNGEVLWIQTLNTLQRRDAIEAADLFAARAARPFRQGSEGWLALRESFEDAGSEAQADYLAAVPDAKVAGESERPAAGHEGPGASYQPRARREGETDDQLAERVAAWDEAQERMVAERRRRLSEATEAARLHAAGMSAEERLDACAAAWRQARFQQAFAARYECEAVYRAVRQPHDHARRRFRDADEVADLDDATRQLLWTRYAELDPVEAWQVPTSASGSSR